MTQRFAKKGKEGFMVIPTSEASWGLRALPEDAPKGRLVPPAHKSDSPEDLKMANEKLLTSQKQLERGEMNTIPEDARFVMYNSGALTTLYPSSFVKDYVSEVSEHGDERITLTFTAEVSETPRDYNELVQLFDPNACRPVHLLRGNNLGTFTGDLREGVFRPRCITEKYAPRADGEPWLSITLLRVCDYSAWTSRAK